MNGTNSHWIVVGVDGSPGADRGLGWAIEEARLRGAGVRVVTAWHVPAVALAGHGSSPPAGIVLEDEIRRAAEGVSQAAARRARDANVPTETRVVEGRPADVLIESSSKSDMLVLGSRPHSTLTGMFVNSVTVQCCLHAEAPTTVVR